MSADSLATDSSPADKPWLVCLDDRFGLAHQIRSKQCRLYSLGYVETQAALLGASVFLKL